ncbi:MAG TPA: hypothetical protein VFL47_15995 [Flavisolibacter sp.]|nr:hypothetical protein [Flavisolibacter sp.]
MINLTNYEEWFVLYLDDELTNEQKAKVDAFVLQHPHLQEELDLLLSTKLPAEPMTFTAKADLLADSMKLNTVDENLLLYIDNELPKAEKIAVEEKISSDPTYRLQHEVLQQAKLSSADVILYPNKKELYRHNGKIAFFPIWMRIAVAVVLVLFATLFFVLNNNQPSTINGLAVRETKVDQKKNLPTAITAPATVLPQNQTATLHTKTQSVATKKKETGSPVTTPEVQKVSNDLSPVQEPVQTASVRKVEPIRLDLARLTEEPAVAVNNLIANSAVTSHHAVAYNSVETPDEAAVTDGDYKGAKRTSAKGFLRKVSRFIEKRTGIGTVNADNELLVGAVALKLN